MKHIRIGAVIGAIACAAISGVTGIGVSIGAGVAALPVIHIEDVDLFYKVYDAADGHPTAAQLQRDYIDTGSDGLHRFARLRNISETTKHLGVDEASRMTRPSGGSAYATRTSHLFQLRRRARHPIDARQGSAG